MTPANPTTLLGLLSHVPDDQTAIIQPEQNIRITYGNLKHQVQDVAEALTPAGISRGDRVGMALPNGLANVVTFLAAPVLTVEMDANGKVSLAGVSSRKSTAVPAVTDTALILHTSGSTGRPKRGPLSHANLAISSGNVARSYALSKDDVSL